LSVFRFQTGWVTETVFSADAIRFFMGRFFVPFPVPFFPLHQPAVHIIAFRRRGKQEEPWMPAGRRGFASETVHVRKKRAAGFSFNPRIN